MHPKQKECATYLLHTSGRWEYLRVYRCASSAVYVPVAQKSARVIFLARRAEQSADSPVRTLFHSWFTSCISCFPLPKRHVTPHLLRTWYVSGIFSPLVCIVLRVFDIRRSFPSLFYQTGRIFGDLRDLTISEYTARSFIGSTAQHIYYFNKK